jgi:hypothetical protein
MIITGHGEARLITSHQRNAIPRHPPELPSCEEQHRQCWPLLAIEFVFPVQRVNFDALSLALNSTHTDLAGLKYSLVPSAAREES